MLTTFEKKVKPVTKIRMIVNVAKARVETERTASRISFAIIVVIDKLFIISIVI